ncbi:MAG: hypothetical protein ACI8T1_003392 [Verrucomicrobiales bacterium]|jgi:hypothetical protein
MYPLKRILFVSALVLSDSLAGVSPIAIYFSNNSADDRVYEVPAGKVLIIESFRQNVGSSGITHLYLSTEQNYVNKKGTFNIPEQFELSSTVASGKIFCLEKSLRFSEGARIKKPTINEVETTHCYVFGLLIDSTDLRGEYQDRHGGHVDHRHAASRRCRTRKQPPSRGEGR